MSWGGVGLTEKIIVIFAIDQWIGLAGDDPNMLN